MFVRVSPFQRVVIRNCRSNGSEAREVFVRRPIIGMSHGLTKTDLGPPSFTADMEGVVEDGDG